MFCVQTLSEYDIITFEQSFNTTIEEFMNWDSTFLFMQRTTKRTKRVNLRVGLWLLPPIAVSEYIPMRLSLSR